MSSNLAIIKLKLIVEYFYDTNDIIKIISELIDITDETIIYKLAKIYHLTENELTKRDDFIDIYYKSNDKDYVLNQLLLASGIFESDLNIYRKKLHDDYKLLHIDYLNYYDVSSIDELLRIYF
mgnify:CR=1 FL=1